MNEYNDRMAQTYSDYEVQDDGGEGAYIRPFAAFIAKWPVDEWKRLPGNQEEVVWNSVDELIAYMVIYLLILTTIHLLFVVFEKKYT